MAGKLMKNIVQGLQSCSFVGKTVTLMSSPSAKDSAALEELAAAVAASVQGKAAAPAKTEAPAPKKWVCTVCGYVYEGEKVPDDYKCPICGVGANLFKQA